MVARSNPPPVSSLPEGFTSARSERPAAYFKVEPGAWIQGLLTGRFPKRDNPGFFFQIRLTKDCPYCVVREDDGTYAQATAEVGDLVSIDQKTCMDGLVSVLDEKKPAEVFVRFKDRLPIKGGKTFWDAEVGVNRNYRAPAGSQQADDSEASTLPLNADGSVPF